MNNYTFEHKIKGILSVWAANKTAANRKVCENHNVKMSDLKLIATTDPKEKVLA